MDLGMGNLEVESDRVYVAYDARTGAIAHVHRVVTHRGATQTSDQRGEAEALDMATRFGHRRERLRVLRAETFDLAVPQRVDLKTLTLSPVASRAAGPRRAAKGTSRKSTSGGRARRR
jgi:hypothetical protein